MDISYPPKILYYLNQALSCLLYIAGIVAGVILVTRKRTLAGILAAVGFLLLGLSMTIGVIGWDIIGPSVTNNDTLAWGVFCLATPMSLLGLIGLVVMAFLIGGKKEKTASQSNGKEPPAQS